MHLNYFTKVQDLFFNQQNILLVNTVVSDYRTKHEKEIFKKDKKLKSRQTTSKQKFTCLKVIFKPLGFWFKIDSEQGFWNHITSLLLIKTSVFSPQA